jgi:hypothetical protein
MLETPRKGADHQGERSEHMLMCQAMDGPSNTQRHDPQTMRNVEGNCNLDACAAVPRMN